MYSTRAVTYKPDAMIAQTWRGWDDNLSRQARYEIYDGYYHNIAYHSLVSYAEALKVAERLYKHVRGVFNPVSRIVELYTAKVYGGMLDTENASSGAIQVSAADDALRQAITRVWQNSRWEQKKSLYVRNGAKFGDSFLKIVDDVQQGTVYMEAMNPSVVKAVQSTPSGAITYLELEYWLPRAASVENEAALPYVLYNETWTPEEVVTTVDGKPAFIHQNGRGEALDRWPNAYGFIPVVHVQHRDVGLQFGATPYYTQLQKINELNDIASNINDAARNQANMPLVYVNAMQPKDTAQPGFGQATDSPRRDSKRVLEIHDADDNRKAAIQTIPPTLSLTDSMTVVNEVLQELERDLPELSLHRLRDGSSQTAPGVRSAYDDAIARIEEARGNYNAGLIEAHKMAVAIGGMRGYAGFQGFNLTSYGTDMLDHNIEVQPVIGDRLSKSEKITFTLQAMQANAPATVYKEIGWDDEATAQLVGTQQTNTNAFMLSQANPAAETPPPPPDDENPEDVFEARRESGVNEADLLAAQDLIAQAG